MCTQKMTFSIDFVLAHLQFTQKRKLRIEIASKEIAPAISSLAGSNGNIQVVQVSTQHLIPFISYARSKIDFSIGIPA